MLSSQIAETEILATIGWLAREGKVKSEEIKKGRRIVELFSWRIDAHKKTTH